MVPERTSWNRIYIQEPLESAYEACFGQALRDYNAAQKRSDRKKENYLREIVNSRNGEKPFYENVVQVGKMTDTPVVDENGNLTEDAKVAIEVLEKYAKTFQERNPNLYMFNCVMHLDEATPHLHIDYIPVAHGYKKGMETRNSLTKAFQQMGFAKAVSKKQNETVAWQQRERAFLTQLCEEKGIEIETLGVKRENLTLPEYKSAMREVEQLEMKAEILDGNNSALIKKNEELRQKINEQVVCNDELVNRAEELINQINELEMQEKKEQELCAIFEMKESTLKMISKEVETEKKKLKGAAIPINNIFTGEEYVKIKKKDWNRIINAFGQAISSNRLLEKYERKISELNDSISELTKQVEKYTGFLKVKNLEEIFRDYLDSIGPKSIKNCLKRNKSVLVEQKKDILMIKKKSRKQENER